MSYDDLITLADTGINPLDEIGLQAETDGYEIHQAREEVIQMAPEIGDPVPTPKTRRERPRDPVAMAALDALLASPEGTSIPVRGFRDEDDARRFGGRVQGYAQRDYDLHIRTNYNRDSETLYLTSEGEQPNGEGEEENDHPALRQPPQRPE